MNKNEEPLNNVLIKSKDSDELSGIESPTKPASLKPDEISTISSRGDKQKEGDNDEPSGNVKKPSEPDDHSPVPVGIENGNMPGTICSGDASQEIKMNNDESEAEVIDFKFKNCDDNQSKMPEEHDRDVYEEDDSGNSEVDAYSEEDDEEEYTEDDEYVPFRNRRRHFSDSDGEESFDEDGEGIDKKDSSHEGVPQVDTESDQDLSQVEGEISDLGKKTEVDGVEEKLKRINRQDPTFVPRQGAFFMHDARDASDDEKDTARHQPPRSKPPGGRAGIASRWAHDLYNEKEQQPRSTNEIIYRYGCNIRERDIGQIDDLMFSPFPVQSRSNNPRGRVRGRSYRHSKNPPPKPDSVVFEDSDFPSLQNAEKSYHRRRGGFTFSRGGNPQSGRPNMRTNDLPRNEVLHSSQTQSQVHQIPGNNQPENKGTHPNSRNHPQRRQDFHRDSNHGNLDQRPGVGVPARNSNSKRYSSNRPRFDEDTQSQRKQQQQQQPTQLVVIRNQPDQSQIHRNNRSYNSNRGGQRSRQTGKKPFCPQSQAGQEKASTPEEEVPVGPAGVSAPRNNE